MNRRKFLSVSVATALMLPAMVWATDYRAVKPDAWTAHTVEDAIKALYGDVKLTQSSDITLKMPKLASNGGAVPVSIKTNIKAKSVSLFQNANPESAVAVWSVPEDGIIDYGLKIKLKGGDNKHIEVTVVVEGLDGVYYTKSALVQVSTTTCEG